MFDQQLFFLFLAVSLLYSYGSLSPVLIMLQSSLKAGLCLNSAKTFLVFQTTVHSRCNLPLLCELKIPQDKNIIQITRTLTLKLTIRKQTYNSLLLKSVSYCYCYCSVTNGIFRSESRALLLSYFCFQLENI